MLDYTMHIRLIFSKSAVIFAAFISGLPLVIRPLQSSMERLEIIQMEEVARTMGCGRLKTFILVTVPQVSNTLISGLLLALARAAGEVGITMMIGGNISGKTNTLSLEIYNSVSRGDFDTALKLCAILGVAGLAIYILLEKHRITEL